MPIAALCREDCPQLGRSDTELFLARSDVSLGVLGREGLGHALTACTPDVFALSMKPSPAVILEHLAFKAL